MAFALEEEKIDPGQEDAGKEAYSPVGRVFARQHSSESGVLWRGHLQ